MQTKIKYTYVIETTYTDGKIKYFANIDNVVRVDLVEIATKLIGSIENVIVSTNKILYCLLFLYEFRRRLKNMIISTNVQRYIIY